MLYLVRKNYPAKKQIDLLMKKILFVCMGNICRSPAAEGIMKKKVTEAKLDDQIIVDSAGTIDYHEGELPDKRMRDAANKRGYTLDSLARKFNRKMDFDESDYIITMDDYNYKVLLDWDKQNKYSDKIYKMKDFSSNSEIAEVPDPYYGDDEDFENVLDILEDTTENLLVKIKKEIERENKKNN